MDASEHTTPAEPAPDGGPFTAIRRDRSFDEVVRQIQDAILGGRFGDGERLPNERDLCRQFEVSRPSLREALRTLEVLGILDIRPGKSGGIFVAAPSGDSVGSVLAALIRLRGASAAELNEFRTSFQGETAACAERDDVERLSRIASDESLRWRRPPARTTRRGTRSLRLTFNSTKRSRRRRRTRCVSR